MRYRRLAELGMLLGFLAGLSLAATPRDAKASSDGDYVGSEVCATCHAEQQQSFVHTVMGNAMAHAKGGRAAGGCVSPLPPGAALPGCSSVLLGTASQYYPYSTVGDTSAARYLFLGADQPSYRAHLLAGSLEYQF